MRLFLAVLVIGALVAGGIYYFRDDVTARILGGLNNTTLNAEVTAEGFRVDHQVVRNLSKDMMDITITGSAGVARPGTPVTVDIEQDPTRIYPTDDFGALTALGTSLDIRLADGSVQPLSPITVQVSIPDDGSAPPDDTVLAFTAADGQLEPLPVTVEHIDGAVVYRHDLSHLSPASIFSIAGELFTEQVSDFFNGFKSLNPDTPDCVGKSVVVDGYEFTAQIPRVVRGTSNADATLGDVDGAVWPCLDVDNRGRITLTLQSSGLTSLLATPDPATGVTGHAVPGNFSESVLAALGDHMQAVSSSVPVYPGGTTILQFDSKNTPHGIRLESNPGPALASTALWMAGATPSGAGSKAANLFPKNVRGLARDTRSQEIIDGRKLEDTAGYLDCAADSIGNLGGEGNETKTAEAVGSCVSAHLGPVIAPNSTGGFSIGKMLADVVAGGIRSVLSQATGILRGLLDADNLYIQITRTPIGTSEATADAIYFRSPSGNVTCGMGDPALAGIWGGADRPDPEVACYAEQYQGEQFSISCQTPTVGTKPGAGALVTGQLPTRGVCSNGYMFSAYQPESIDVLDYGESVTWHGFTCQSDYVTGITCKEAATGYGFTVSRDIARTIGGDGTDYLTAASLPNDSPMDAGQRLFTSWKIKGLEVFLLPNYTGHIHRNSGAITATRWQFTWVDTGAGTARLTVTSIEQSSELDSEITVGAIYDVSMRGDETAPYLELTGPVSGAGRDFSGYRLCPTDVRTACDE